MVKAVALFLLKSSLVTWLSERALHVPDAQVGGVAKQFGVSPTTWREIEKYQAGRAIAGMDTILK